MELAGPQSLLIITGSMGSGKTAVMLEASDILTRRGILHAAIDLDILGIAHLPSDAACDEVMFRNLHVVTRNYVAAGINRFLLARALENRLALDRCIAEVGAEAVVVCRLIASIATMQQRVGLRELGMDRSKYIQRVSTLQDTIDRAQLEDFEVRNEGRSITEVASELLERSNWVI